MLDLNKIPFQQARNFTKAGRALSSIGLIVTHTMENDERPDGAENVASWFAGSTAPQASAHFCLDNNSVVQCVRLADVAWGAPNANHNGVHVEWCGRAAQQTRDWHDPFSNQERELGAQLYAALAHLLNIPVRWLEPADLKAGMRGITSHANVSKAFPNNAGNHWDPGPNFPHGELLSRVSAILRAK